MSVQLIDRELDRLENLWEDGLSDAYRSYLEAVAAHEPAAQPKLALAAALVEIGIRLQGLGGRAAAPPSLLMGDLCLARSSRLLADAATQAVQIAFARAIEAMSTAAASGASAPAARELLLHALKAS
ncbi:MAG TPA: hypothetical protein VNU27_11295 [Candidatus Acidoferrum sp.]|jgi:hypothetical protein|nr:hypothetical protein [Candidatus Acidoferrum sp.]